ncbi:glycine--tRNA ligase subunit beta [Qipengyuania atrilutea]|uniref:Glycine--tRNA ligase beta subunit n=1 Tax=Qipengyuania atrilutea TaxID=2744473 RepID=A0A850GZE1_9SPHN|nr:glycine--tRNA ligase subunit beta [Actirhodobacter atriluteus]NVD43767.1 glycine--tRNA ligase subunit beta [Actirhodobacter atriluteus]
MSGFLLELRSEEIPARMQAGARAELEKLFRREMEAAGVECGVITVWSTPRRLALIARDLPEATEAVSEEAKGPPEGAPDQAIEGFCRKNGVTREQLEVRDVKGRATYFAVKNVPGHAMKDLLAEAIPAIVRDFSWPKSMRWGEASMSTESLRWVRPLSGIVALLDDDVVECEVHGVTSGVVTLGHRFHHSGDITIGNADDYAVKLRAAHVIVDHEERAALIREGAAQVASEAGLTLIKDEGLVTENAGLTEWPIPLLGRFDEAFLEVPPEVIQLTARVNQKYFVCETDDARLANAFICTANIEAEDGGAAIVDGNRKVLAARLSDARFFWQQDRKKSLAQHAEGLKRITFHEKLGTVADKVDRVAKLARWLVEEGIVKNADADLAEQAARLAKADLVTEMVGEFPELQGLMGGYYARAEGLPDEVADAIRDHYKPVGQGDEVPTAPVTVAVSLADKLDTLVSFFLNEMRPTGSKDPFALRRATLAIVSVVFRNHLRVPFDELVFRAEEFSTVERFARISSKIDEKYAEAIDLLGISAAAHGAIARARYDHDIKRAFNEMFFVRSGLQDFVLDRLKVQQREAGVRHDLIDAVFALGGEDDLVRLLARVKALQNYIETAEGADLLAAYKRASNILKKEDWEGSETLKPQTGEEDPLALVDDPDMAAVVAARGEPETHRKELPYMPEPAEKQLNDALDAAEPKAESALADERFEDAMAALATLRGPIDAFFENVTVNDPDQDKRAARLDLLARFRDAVHRVADFGRIEG